MKTEAYQKGHAAWWCDLTESANPYNPQTNNYKEWLLGFHDAENEWLYKECGR